MPTPRTKALLAGIVVFVGLTAAIALTKGRRYPKDVLPGVELPVLIAKTINGNTCFSGESLPLRTQTRLHRTAPPARQSDPAPPASATSDRAPLVEPNCFYIAGWSGRPSKCVVDYSATDPSGYATTSLAARLASTYYETQQIGLLYFTSPGSDRAYVMLDHRWCTWFGVAPGLSLNAQGKFLP